jgi:GH35 family endo-1,4-beta-xylanase/acetyl esterase/lipase
MRHGGIQLRAFLLHFEDKTGKMRIINVSAILLVSVLTSVTGNLEGQSPETFINQRFTNVTVTDSVRFAAVTDYKGRQVTLMMDIYQPEGDNSANRPVIIWIHGGGFRSGSLRTQGYIVNFATSFAKRGYVCMSIDYRLRDSRDLPDRKSEFPALQDAARDANTAIDWVRENAGTYRIDPGLIFIAGGSAGGRAAVTLAQFPGPDKSAAHRPETNYRTVGWNKTGIIAGASLWGAPEPEMREWIYPYLGKNSIPMVLIHGGADSTISVQNSKDLHDAMKMAGVSSELHIIPGAPHTPANKDTNPRIEEWIARFFVKEWLNSIEKTKDQEADLNESIAEVRKGTLTVKAKPGSQVTVEQLSHEFWFGCAISNGLGSGSMAENDLKQYKEIFLQNFNSAVTENAVKWGTMEPRRGEINYSTIDGILRWTDENNIPLRGHNLFWGIPQFVQPWVKELNDEELSKTLQTRAETVTARYRGRFAEYDLNNEMIHGNWYEERLGEGITLQMAEWAKKGDPDIKLWLNDYDILTGNRLADYMAHIRKLIKQGVPVAGIGVQGHLHGSTFDRSQLKRALDSLAVFKLPVRITEFNMPGQRSKYYSQKINVMTPAEEAIKAREIVDYYRICFAHPAVEGILMWGFWEGANWIPVSSLYRRDWTPTPSAAAYQDLLFREWWTKASGTAGKSGSFATPAFYGKYRITVNGKSKEILLSAKAGQAVVDFGK